MVYIKFNTKICLNHLMVLNKNWYLSTRLAIILNVRSSTDCFGFFLNFFLSTPVKSWE
jgi:hypothetical protein